ncbi:hypothetical protein IJ847_02565 [Candidatus Saccharibacteria bacterium]|nr:hypothetical protein [Candidatus Saccharibacteria bacterium]
MKANQELELEITILPKRIPKEIIGKTPAKMVDIYIPEDAPHAHLRVRKKDGVMLITKKRPLADDPSTQVETSIPLDETEYAALCRASNRRIEKERYKVEIAGRMAEVDVFGGALKGLMLVDFEFENEQARADFELPNDLVLADVTREEFVAGGWLAGKSYDDIRDKLDNFGYKAL